MGFLGKEHGNLSCSFCGKSQKEVQKLVAGPAVYICDACVNDAWALIRSPEAQATNATRHRVVAASSRTICCSFCGKPRSEIDSMVAGQSTYICNECLSLCNDIIAEELSRERKEPNP